MSSNIYLLSEYDQDRSIKSYRDHVPSELHDLKIWMPSIHRRPLLQFSGDKKGNLMTFEQAIAKLLDEIWMTKRREFHIKHGRETLASGVPHLSAVFIDTKYCYIDPDHRQLVDDKGNKIGNKDAFDEDQISAMAVVRDFCPGWESWSGNGFHGLMRRSDKTNYINADKVNLLGEDGKYLVPYELKFHTCFLPPYLVPINDIREIPHALPQVEAYCEIVRKHKLSKNKSSKNEPDPEVTLPLEAAIESKKETTPPEQETTPPAGNNSDDCVVAPIVRPLEKDRLRLLDQYKYLANHNVPFIPKSHAEYGAWHKRLTTMGFSKKRIKELASKQSGYAGDKDDNDIDKSEPYPDVEKQVRIEFARVKELFDKHKLNIRDSINYREKLSKENTEPTTADASSITDSTADDSSDQFNKELAFEEFVVTNEKSRNRKLPPLICEGLNFAPRGEHSALAARPGFGKTSITAYEVAEATKQGKKVLYVSLDQGWELTSRYLRAYGVVDDMVFLLTDPKYATMSWIMKVVETFKPDIFIGDSMFHFFCRVLPIITNRQFKQNDPLHWVEAMEWWKAEFLIPNNLSGYGIYHPSRTEPFQFPHSGLLTAYTHRCDILVPQIKLSRRNKFLIEESWVAKIVSKHKGSTMRWCIRDRNDEKSPSQLYRYDNDYDRDVFNAEETGIKPKPIVMIDDYVTRPENYSEDNDDIPIRKEVETPEDIRNIIANKAGGYGKSYQITETEAYKTLNCYSGGKRRQASDAENRRNLYAKAKDTGLLAIEGNEYRGYKVWAIKPDSYIDQEAYSTRGYQDS